MTKKSKLEICRGKVNPSIARAVKFGEENAKGLKEDFDKDTPMFSINEMGKWMDMQDNFILTEIDKLIADEKWYMATDKYSEQELEHINQIEMAEKIKKIIREMNSKNKEHNIIYDCFEKEDVKEFIRQINQKVLADWKGQNEFIDWLEKKAGKELK